MGRLTEFEDFFARHEASLAASGVPPTLHRQVFSKVTTDRFDGGDYFSIELLDGGRSRRLVAAKEMRAESDVFLVDHAWSFRLNDARQQLQTIPGLADRMAAMMGVSDDVISGAADVSGASDGTSSDIAAAAAAAAEEDKVSLAELISRANQTERESNHPLRWLELDDAGLSDDDLAAARIPEQFPDLEGLSLWGNRLSNVDSLLDSLKGLHKLKALWLNGNPLEGLLDSSRISRLSSLLPSLQLLSSRLLPAYGPWAAAFCAEIYGPDHPGPENDGDDVAAVRDIRELDVSHRGLTWLNPAVFNPRLLPHLLSLDLRGNILSDQSSDDILRILSSLPSLQALKVDIPGPLGSSPMAILSCLRYLKELNGVPRRVWEERGEREGAAAARGGGDDEVRGGVLATALEPRLPSVRKDEPVVDRVLRALWQHVMVYRLTSEEKIDETPVWYVMDELGSAIRHSDASNLAAAPFLYFPSEGIQSAASFTLIWPTADITVGDEVARDYLPGIGEEKQRSARLTAFFHTPKDFFRKALEVRRKRLAAVQPPAPLPRGIIENLTPGAVGDGEGGSRVLSVFSDVPQVRDLLTRQDFKLVDDISEADIIWMRGEINEEFHRMHAIGQNHRQITNQFPFEACIVMKHHLAATIEKAFGSPPWLQPTFNLEAELAALIGEFYEREEQGEDNLWILKPWNMARSIDTSVTKHLPQIIRMLETGPKIAQKYISNPALLGGKKFDLRVLLLVRSLQPLDAAVSRVFWARLANNAYTTSEDSLLEFETHFTVMNYVGKMNHVPTHDFVAQLELEHKVKWHDISTRIRSMLYNVLQAAVVAQPKMHDENARAIYGVDVMLDANMQPKLLEVTYCPDLTRACTYDMKDVEEGATKAESWLRAKEFVNNIFGYLFLGEQEHVIPL